MIRDDPKSFSLETSLMQIITCANRAARHLRLIASITVIAFCLLRSVAHADDTKAIQELISQVNESVVTIRVEGRDGNELGIGTGFVIDSEGLIATNFHVINEGRQFTVTTHGGEKLSILGVEASDRNADLAIIRVAKPDDVLPELALSNDSQPEQGMPVLAFGNPLGLTDSVVDGIVSAVRQVQQREMIQLAMPIEPGNSGGPLVDRMGTVVGIINMKSAIDDNLGFAIPISQLRPLLEKPNPVSIERWVRFGTIDEERWQPILGATWRERGGVISAQGLGKGFGGRALCLSRKEMPKKPFEIAVMVKLDDESGAAGLAFHSDGADKHYGFYPSNGRMRLTCFRGATVYSWQVLEEVESDHYLPGQWNRLHVRVEEDTIQCFVNGELVITSRDQQLREGQIGLAKFRGTKPDFRAFEFGPKLARQELADSAAQWLEKLKNLSVNANAIGSVEREELGGASEIASQELIRRASMLEQQAKQIRRLADDVRLVPTLDALKEVFSGEDSSKDRLLDAALLVGQLDERDTDVEYYKRRVVAMAEEIRDVLPKDTDQAAKRKALDDYLFSKNGFHGGRSEYYHPANSHMNRVIDDREGLPITLSILYMELGKRLGMKIEGVGLPGHFVVRHMIDADNGQLIDVFDGGKSMSDDEAAAMVRQFTGRRITDHDLRPQTDLEIITRVLSNLMGIATRSEDLESMLRYIEAMVAIDPDAHQFRLMRAQLRGMTKRNALALEDIDWLITKSPPEIDLNRLQQMRDALTK